MKRYICTVCGYVHEGEEPPGICPICNVGKDKFELVEDASEEPPENAAPKRWYCSVCGYVHEGDHPPDLCPICGVGADLFDLKADEESSEDQQGFGKIIVIGAGIAGLSAVEAICRRTARAEVTLISEEEELPYYRLNLTRFLAGEVDKDALTIRDAAWYTDKGVTLLNNAQVKRIDRYGKLVALSDNTMMMYDRLVIATGAQPFVPPIPGIDLDGVHTLRSVKDAETILAGTGEGKRIICIGGGILGLEIAGALNRQKADVTVLSIGPSLMPRQLTPDAAAEMETRITKLGITVENNASTKDISDHGAVRRVTLEDGRVLEADLVVVAVGIKANTAVAQACGLECNRGIIVNDMMKTSDPDVFAAGDVAEQHGVMYGLWHPAMLQGAVAGSNATGASETFDGIPPTTVIKVLGIGMFSAGELNKTSEAQVRFNGHCSDAYYDLLFDNSRLIGANEVGDVSLSTTLSHLIEDHVDMSEHLTDGQSLESLLGIIRSIEQK